MSDLQVRQQLADDLELQRKLAKAFDAIPDKDKLASESIFHRLLPVIREHYCKSTGD